MRDARIFWGSFGAVLGQTKTGQKLMASDLRKFGGRYKI